MPFKPTDYLPYDFANRRHIGPSPAEMSDMLKMVGAPNLNALIDETLPESIRQKEPLISANLCRNGNCSITCASRHRKTKS